MNPVHVTSNLSLLGFALASVTYLVAFQKGARQSLLLAISLGLFTLATVSATSAACLAAQTSTLSDMSAVLLTSAIGWLAVLGHLRFNMRLIGAFVAPLSTLILLMKFFVAPTPLGVDAQDIPALMQTHIVFAILGQAFAIIACAVSILYLWQQALLKKKLLDQMATGLPAIDKLGGSLGIALWCGFVFITLSLLSGALYTQLNVPSPDYHVEFKVIWAICVWIWYLATLLAKNVFGRPSKRIAQMSLGGFLLLAVTYFGMGFFRPFGGG